MTSVNERRSAVIQRVYDEWAADVVGRVQPDTEFATGDDSQYAEGMAALSASAADQAEFHRRVREALSAAGLPETT